MKLIISSKLSKLHQNKKKESSFCGETPFCELFYHSKLIRPGNQTSENRNKPKSQFATAVQNERGTSKEEYKGIAASEPASDPSLDIFFTLWVAIIFFERFCRKEERQKDGNERKP